MTLVSLNTSCIEATSSRFAALSTCSLHLADYPLARIVRGLHPAAGFRDDCPRLRRSTCPTAHNGTVRPKRLKPECKARRPRVPDRLPSHAGPSGLSRQRRRLQSRTGLSQSHTRWHRLGPPGLERPEARHLTHARQGFHAPTHAALSETSTRQRR